MAFEMSDNARILKVFNFSADTNEYIGHCDVYVAPNIGLPAYCTNINPPKTPEGHVAIFDEKTSEWFVIEDHRGQQLFKKDTGEMVIVDYLGVLPECLTELSPGDGYKMWDETSDAWIQDVEAEKLANQHEYQLTKKKLLDMASDIITPLQYAVDLNMATEKECLELLEWKKYVVLVSRVGTNDEWPKQPTGLATY